MSKPEVVFRVVDRAGNVHRLKAVELVTEHGRVSVFRSADYLEVASFVEPIAVTLDSAESLVGPGLVQGEACTTVIQSAYGVPPPILWGMAVYVAGLIVMRAIELLPW